MYSTVQGTSDACLWWIVQSNIITLAYELKATLWTIYLPNYSQYFNQVMDASMDDKHLTMGQPHLQPLNHLIHQVQYHLMLWHDLLQASGGVLIPSKCIWLCFNWHINTCSQPTIVPPSHATPLLTITVHGSTAEPVQLLQLHKAHRYLGIYVMMDDNYKTELNTFKKCNSTYVNLLQTCPFSQHEIQVIYKQCYLPTMAYLLLATFLLVDQLYKIQSLMGYSQSFPQAITYALAEWGSLGFQHLGYEQGVQKFLQVLKHLCTKASIGQVITIALENYPLLVGFAHPVLEDTHYIPWCNAPLA